MNREEALKAIRENVKNEHLIRHMLATEVIMRALAGKFDGDEEEWGLSGLLHDIDVELTAGDMYRHSREGADIVRKLGAGEPVAAAVLCHNETHGILPKTVMEKALFCTDPLTGLITASVLVRPDKKISSLEAKSVRKRFKEKSFAAGACRESIARCSDIGLELDEFIAIGVSAMQGIADNLGF
jgi:putative nucleotidyltransferase with HDIG domain